MNVRQTGLFVHSLEVIPVVVACAILAGAVPARPQGLETESRCAIWVVRNAIGSAEAWQRALEAVDRSGCRRMYLQVSGRWDAYYPSDVFGPPEAGPVGARWEDPFGTALAQAHSRGIEVHAWVNAMLAWSAPRPPANPRHVYHSAPEWFVVDGNGTSMRDLSRGDLDRRGLTGEGWFLDPAIREVRTELRRFLLELARSYPVDGIHLDYIRYPAGWADDESSQTISYLLQLVRHDLMLVRPSAILSAAVLPVPHVAEETFGQAWVEWVERGIVDEVLPMIYRDDVDSVLEVVEEYPEGLRPDRVWVGLRVDRLSATEREELRSRLTALGFAGIALFSHNLLIEP